MRKASCAERRERSPQGYYVSPSINLLANHDPKSVYQHSEIFGPNVAILACDDIDKAIDIANSSGFGLVCSIFTKDQTIYKRVFDDARVDWSTGTARRMERVRNFHSVEIRKSGNDRASGHLAIQYCSVPVACLEDQTQLAQAHVMPGMDFEVTKITRRLDEKSDLIFLFVVVLLAAAVVMFEAFRFLNSSPSRENEVVVFDVNPGQSFRAVAQRLKDQAFITDLFMFRVYAKLTRADQNMRVGNHALSRNMNPGQILRILKSGKSSSARSRFVKVNTCMRSLPNSKRRDLVRPLSF